MTIFVASLFLPHTIHFDVDSKRTPTPQFSRKPSQIRVGDYYHQEPTLALFTPDGSSSLQSGTITPTLSMTPGLVPGTVQNDFFIAGDELNKSARSSINSRSGRSSISKTLPLTSLRSIAPGEPHSPAWGRKGHFTQPKSRAENLPSSSILEHGKSRAQAAALADIREQSRDRALTEAEWTIQPAEQGNGGLRNAVTAACRDDPTLEKTWVGTLGMPTDALDPDRKQDIESKLQEEHDCLTVFPTDSDFDGHYSHYCKTILWPMFHYQIPDNPKSKAYEDHSWVYYAKVNQNFADRIVSSYKKGDTIWIHDYHLLLVPAMIRKKLPDAQIGFFLHVAFPSSEVFRCLSVREELLKGLLGANLIGFQTEEFGIHFLQTCNRLLFVEATPNGVQLEDRFVNVAAFPIGVDLETLERRRQAPGVLQWVDMMQHKYPEKRLIVARDKLDYVRGVRQKLLAYELFLNKYPHFADKVVLIQVATSTTDQGDLDATIAEIVTRINSNHSTLAHQPLVYLKQDMEYQQYIAMLTSADVLMITSLREGMNLTSHEYLFCQDGFYGKKKHGSLILSEFTGSSSLFEGNELAVNPWDYRQCSEAIRKALEMRPEEKAERWQKLMAVVKHHNAGHWFSTFLSKLRAVHAQHESQHTISIPRLSFAKLSGQYKASSCRLFMLDYEGTLAPHESPSTMQFNSPQRTIDTMADLLLDDGNIVYVMSGKKPEELAMLFQRVPGLGMVAENGCYLKSHDSETWQEAADLEEVKRWQESIIHILEYYRDRTDGSCIEARHCSVIFHIKDATDPAAAARTAGECGNHINDACQSLKIHAVPVEGGLVVESTQCSKGTAATRIFEGLKKQNSARGLEPPRFLFVAGDSREDEVIYRWANQLGTSGEVSNVTTVSVSSRNTEAKSTLTQGVTGVLSTLQKLATL